MVFGSGFLNKLKKKRVTKVILPQICLTITSKQTGSLLSPRLWLSRMLPHFNRQGEQSRNYINWRKGIFVHLLHSQSCLHIRDFTLKIIYLFIIILKKGLSVSRFRSFTLFSPALKIPPCACFCRGQYIIIYIYWLTNFFFNLIIFYLYFG